MASGFHILIVQDEPLASNIISTILETEYRVTVASTVEAAHGILRRSHIDVTIIDSILPDGRDAEVAVVAEIVGAAVIEMTGDPQEHIGLVESGHQHLFKPFAANVLLATVEDVLHSHQRSVIGAISMSAKARRREIPRAPRLKGNGPCRTFAAT